VQRPAVRLRIRGRVQGVGYRWWAVGEARRLGLDGWVRNRTDGSVELHAAGAPEALDALAEACRLGPSGARVEEIDRLDAEDDGVRGFEQAPTA
jgi:acylphosphatase